MGWGVGTVVKVWWGAGIWFGGRGVDGGLVARGGRVWRRAGDQRAKNVSVLDGFCCKTVLLREVRVGLYSGES